MEHNPTGLPVGDRGDHPGAALGEPLQVRPVIERRSELRAVLPHIPELSILHSVERQVDRPQHRRPRRDIRTNLVVIAKVDHRANPVVNHRCPSSRGQPVQRIGTDQRTPPRLPAVDRGQPAEIAGVEAALPIQVSSDARAHNTILQPSTTTAAARGVVDAARPPATNPSSPTARRSSRPAAAPPAAVIRLPRITRPRQGNRGLQIPLDVRCVRLPLTAGFRLAGTINGKTGAHARIIEADLQLPAYPIRQLVGDLADPATVVRRRTGLAGESRDPYKRISPPEYFEKLAGIVVPRDGLVSCPAAGHVDRIPSCSVGTSPDQGWCCHAGGCGARGAIYDLASVVLGGPWGHELRGEAFNRARDYVADVFGDARHQSHVREEDRR